MNPSRPVGLARPGDQVLDLVEAGVEQGAVPGSCSMFFSTHQAPLVSMPGISSRSPRSSRGALPSATTSGSAPMLCSTLSSGSETAEVGQGLEGQQLVAAQRVGHLLRLAGLAGGAQGAGGLLVEVAAGCSWSFLSWVGAGRRSVGWCAGRGRRWARRLGRRPGGRVRGGTGTRGAVAHGRAAAPTASVTSSRRSAMQADGHRVAGSAQVSSEVGTRVVEAGELLEVQQQSRGVRTRTARRRRS